MKILFISRLFPHSQGISGSLIINNRIRFLAERGHQVGLASFVTDEDKPHVNEIKPYLQEMELFPAPEVTRPFARAARCMASTTPFPFCDARVPGMRKAIGEMIERSRYNIAIAEFSAMGQYLFKNPWLPAVRRIVSCHECWTTGYLKSIRFHGWSARGLVRRFTFDHVRRYEFGMYMNMDHILVLTPEERYRLLKHAPNLRISVVPHGVDTDYFSPPASDNSEESIVFVGYYHNESNRDAVLWFVKNVWPGLKKKHPGVKFYVVGRGPVRVITDLARHDPAIIVTGGVVDIRPDLAKARAFICPIRMGSGFRAKLLEAMAAGVPVVSTSLAAEGISSWGCDTMFMADTPRQMLRSISLLITDPGLRQSMAANAREMVVSRFAKESGLSVLDNVVREVVTRD
jgi:glycosyltransferase involved in cell wall biosynthesis